jgi:hypothetical protein
MVGNRENKWGTVLWNNGVPLSLSLSLYLSTLMDRDPYINSLLFLFLSDSTTFIIFLFIYFHDFLKLEYSHFFSFKRIDWQAKISLFKAALIDFILADVAD